MGQQIYKLVLLDLIVETSIIVCVCFFLVLGELCWPTDL